MPASAPAPGPEINNARTRGTPPASTPAASLVRPPPAPAASLPVRPPAFGCKHFRDGSDAW
jgi:hypothetical protein